MASLSISPLYAYNGTTGNVFTVTGTGTNFTTPSQITVNFGSITNCVINSTTSATITVTAPSISDSVAVTDTTSGAVTYFSSLIPMTDPHIFYRGSWEIAGSGAWANSAHSNFSVNLVLPASGQIRLYATGGASASMYMKAMLGPGAVQNTTINSSSLIWSVLSGLSAQTAEFRCYIEGRGTSDAWTSNPPSNSLLVYGIHAPGATTAAPTTLSGACAIYGDSRIEGYNNTAAGQQDATWICGVMIAEAFNCEPVIHAAYAGQGWTCSGDGNVPPLFTPGNAAQSSWNLISSGVSRAFPSNLQYLFVINMGGNDYTTNQGNSGLSTPSQVEASVAGFCAAARAAVPAGCWIFIYPSFEGHYNSVVQTGVANYQAATPDPRTVYLPNTLTAIQQACQASAAYPNQWSFEGVHSNLAMHGMIAGRIAQAAQAAIQPAFVPVGFSGGLRD